MGPLDLPQESEELLVAVLGHERRGHLPGRDVQRREQGRGAMPVMVVRAALDAAFLHRQDRRRPVQRLDLGLLIDTHHDRVGWDIGVGTEVEPTDVGDLANPHGDVVTTVTVPDSGPAAGIDSWHAYDEHGNTIIGTIGEPPLKDTTGIGYGWVGNEQRATQTTGLLLMGARLYNPATGTFTSMDPVFGGNTTTYAYPQDPINAYDLDGQWGVPGWAKSAAKSAGRAIRKRRGTIITVGGAVADAAAIGACGATIVCGVAVGAGAAAGTYAAHQAATGKKIKKSGIILSAGTGAGCRLV